MVVIYDPSAGFVTGGGYVTHQATWTTPPTPAGGKDNFGFVAKYKNGASKPEGETEFQCKDCNINFHSTSLDWLIVNTITSWPERRRPEGVVPGFRHDQWGRRLLVPGDLDRQGQHGLLPDEDPEQDHQRGHLRQHAVATPTATSQ